MNTLVDLNVPLQEEGLQDQLGDGVHEEQVHAAHPFNLNVLAQEQRITMLSRKSKVFPSLKLLAIKQLACS